MEECPRCQNYEIDKNDNFCKICGLDLRKGTAAGTAALGFNPADLDVESMTEYIHRGLKQGIDDMTSNYPN